MKFDPADPAFIQDPYPTYAWLRANDPVHYAAEAGYWVVTRYADCLAILKNHAVFSSSEGSGPMKVAINSPSMINADPPDHTRLRGLVAKAFTPRSIAEKEGHVQDVVDGLIDQVIAGGSRFDVVEALANPLPMIVIAEIIGIEPEKRDDFKRWSNHIIRLVGGDLKPEDMPAAGQSFAEFNEYMGAQVRARRAEPRDDLLTRLVQAETEGDRLRGNEILTFLALMLVAGNETTTNLIGNGASHLARFGKQARRVLEDVSLVPSAVEEALRYESPIQGLFRTPKEDVMIEGKTIRKGEKVQVFFAAANRDPMVFEEPDWFDVERTPNPHMAFGAGIHFCLGSALARMEARIALETTLRRLPNLRPDPDAGETIVQTNLTRGRGSVPLVWG